MTFLSLPSASLIPCQVFLSLILTVVLKSLVQRIHTTDMGISQSREIVITSSVVVTHTYYYKMRGFCLPL